MKKILATIVLMAYFMVSTGFIVCVHYCMDRFDSAQLGASDSDECGKCGMHKDGQNKCCRDDVKVVKMNTDHLASSVYSFISLAAPAPERPIALIDQPVRNFSLYERPVAHAPPLSGQDTYLQNRVFRI